MYWGCRSRIICKPVVTRNWPCGQRHKVKSGPSGRVKSVIASLVCVALAACMSPAQPLVPAQTRNVVEWSEAIRILNEGNVVLTSQTHDLYVTLELKDGARIYTTEPFIDAIVFEVSKCAACGEIPFVTE